MTILNLTPHSITVGDVTFPASGTTCRLEVEPTPSDFWTSNFGVPVVERKVKSITFSSPVDWTQVGAVIVSAQVAQSFHAMDGSSVPHRVKVLTVGETVKDESGVIVGAKYLVYNKGH